MDGSSAGAPGASRAAGSSVGCTESAEGLDRLIPLRRDMTFDGVIGGVPCSLLLDTGSSINLMSKSVFDVLISRPPLMKTSTVAKTATLDSLPLLGRAKVSLKLAGQTIVMPFFVTDSIDVPVLLGLEFLATCPCVVDISGGQLVLVPSRVVRSISASVISVGRVIVQ